MASPLGYCVAGRLPGTFQQADDVGTKFVATITNVQDILNGADDITLFLTGASPLPGNHLCAALYIAGGPPHTDWTYVGSVSNEVPCAFLKLRLPDAQRDRTLALGPAAALQLGVSIEQRGLQPPLPAHSHYQEFAKFIAFDLFRFLESFSSVTDRINVPTSTLDQWYQKFTDRMAKDPQFWKQAAAKGA